jgi:hypothetical protein
MALEPVAMTSAGTTPRAHEYERGRSDWELERLRRQAELVDPSLASSLRRWNLERHRVPGRGVWGPRYGAPPCRACRRYGSSLESIARLQPSPSLTYPTKPSERRPVASDGASGEDCAVAAVPNGLKLDLGACARDRPRWSAAGTRGRSPAPSSRPRKRPSVTSPHRPQQARWRAPAR